jgi:hypothetical protein
VRPCRLCDGLPSFDTVPDHDGHCCQRLKPAGRGNPRVELAQTGTLPSLECWADAPYPQSVRFNHSS